MKGKLLLVLLTFLMPIFVYGEPLDGGGFGLSALSCPEGTDYGICGGVNYTLHNQFINYIKKKDATNAIKTWDKMTRAVDGINENSGSGWISNTLIGWFAPEGITPLPLRIYAKKAYKGGVMTLGSDCVQDCDFSLYYISYMRYKKVNNQDMLYFYNEPLAPTGSQQYKSYTKLYTNFSEFDKDATSAFYKGKFNNKYTNMIYQKFIKSIK